ncbi:MAG: KxYKxGKxW signal peptide domain-containing protein [Rhodoluna sp.]|nr:KxYKxGKxW signal peptide domain-containing protein [Rhodoluna sp.]
MLAKFRMHLSGKRWLRGRL